MSARAPNGPSTGLSGFSPGNAGWIGRAFPPLPGVNFVEPQARTDVVQLAADYWGSAPHANLSVLTGAGLADGLTVDSLQVGAINDEDLIAIVSADCKLDDSTTRGVLLKAGAPNGTTFVTVGYAQVSTSATLITLQAQPIVLPRLWKLRFNISALTAGKKLVEFNVLYVPLRYGQYACSL